MSNLIEMKSLDINGNKFECVDGYAREQIVKLEEAMLRPTRIDVKFKDCIIGAQASYGGSIGDYVPQEDRIESNTGAGTVACYVANVKQGDFIVTRKDYTNSMYVTVYDKDGHLAQRTYYQEFDYERDNDGNYLEGKCEAICDGTLYYTFYWFEDAGLSEDTIVFTLSSEESSEESSEQATFQLPEYDLIPVTENDVLKETYRTLGDAPVHAGSSAKFSDYCSLNYSSASQMPGYCTFDCKINKGDMIIFTHLSDMYSRLGGLRLVVVDDDDNMIEVVEPSEVRFNKAYMYYVEDEGRTAGAYKFKTSGTLYMCFKYTDVYFAEYFYIKRTHPTEPFVLNTLLSAEYESGVYPETGIYPDNYFGDEALKAIMEGRQILVRIQNQGAEQTPHTALYSPIYQYQLPNYRNDYLYLFYLEDYKQTIDLSAVGLGQIEIPVYGQLKLKVSREYHQSPLV